MPKIRIDQLLVQKGFAPSREKAQAIIIAGNVLANEQKITKPGTTVTDDVTIRILGDQCPYVSRGGLKLAGALDLFKINPTHKIALDIGASTGGFTDCLLQRGAQHVVALDVGHSQLDWKIRSDKRVTVIEKYNFRFITPNAYNDMAPNHIPELAVIDVSFISIDKILPPLFALLPAGGEVVSLVKPQFEAGREHIEKGGLVTDPSVHHAVMQKIKDVAIATGYTYIADCPSPITGTDGNKEFFVYLRKS